MAMNWMKARHQTEVEHAFRLCRYSLVLVAGLSFFVNLLALTVPLYLLHIYDHVLASRSTDTLTMLTLIVVVALAVHATLEMLRRTMLARIGVLAGRPAAGPGADCRGSGRAARRRGRGRAGLARCRHAAHLLRRQRLHGALRPALDADLPARHGARAPAARRHRLRRLGGAVRAGRVQRAGDPQALFALERGLGRNRSTVSRRCCAMSRRSARWACCPASPGCCARTRPAPSRRSWPPRRAARRSRRLPASPASSPR